MPPAPGQPAERAASNGISRLEFRGVHAGVFIAIALTAGGWVYAFGQNSTRIDKLEDFQQDVAGDIDEIRRDVSQVQRDVSDLSARMAAAADLRERLADAIDRLNVRLDQEIRRGSSLEYLRPRESPGQGMTP